MKITLREIFLLVALVAMGCGWWVHSRQLNHYLDRSHLVIQKLAEHFGADVAFSDGSPSYLYIGATRVWEMD